jgi:tRNA dimethylallyltransferase
MAFPIIFLVGPTASGKSKIALNIAKRLHAEIISCDSMQVYRGMNIGTAKPTKAEQRKIPHHLIDLKAPKSEFSVFEYRKRVLKTIEAIKKKGKTPIIVGGSGLYAKAIIDGLAPQPGKVIEIRNSLKQLADKKGGSYLYSKLKEVDPERSKEIHPNDLKRIIRALEVWELSKRPISDWEKETEGLDPESYIVFGLLWKREELYKRVEKRVDQMISDGWVNEVKKLKRRGLSQTAQMAIGYCELLKHLKGLCGLEEAAQEIKKRTRHLVKKQMTWFRRDPRIDWIKVGGKDFVTKASKKILQNLKKRSV